MKKGMAIFLALLLTLSLLPVSALAAEGDQLVTVAGDTETEGQLTLRQAVAAVANGGTVSFADGVGDIYLDAPLTIDKAVNIQLSGQTITAGYDTTEDQTTLAVFIVAKGGHLTLQGNGSVKTASPLSGDLDPRPTPFGVFVQSEGALAVKDKAGMTAGDDTACLISLASNTALTLTTQANLTGGAAGVVAPSGATAYSVNIDMGGTISSKVALSLADSPAVQISNAVLLGSTRAIDASVTLESMAAPGYRAFLRTGSHDNALPDEVFAAAPDSSVTGYVFKIPPVTYTVRYDYGNGFIMSEETVEEGQTPPDMKVEGRDGYIFTGWEPALGPVTADTTYVAQWAVARTVTWADGFGGTIHTETVADGTPVTPFEGVPQPREGYVFTGWDKELPATITEDITITAQWEKLMIVKYEDGQGKVLQTDYVKKGDPAPSYTGEDPVREGFTFKGWDKELPETITEDITLTAVWEAVVVTHTVTYVDGQGKTLHTDTVIHGQPAPAYGEKPTRDGYAFTGWDKELPAAITEDITLTAQWVAAHTVIYVDGQGKTLHTDTVIHGQPAPAYTQQPAREGYAFAGWDKTLPATITEDVTLTAQWVAVHTVSYVDGQGNTLHTDKVNHGQAAPVYSDKPSREGYTFKGWDKALPATITEDVTLTAQWEIITHTVKYVDGQGKTLHTDTVDHGKAAPVYTDKPTREGYSFQGWDKTLPETITEDITLTALWSVVSAPTLTSRAPVRLSETNAIFYFTSSETGYYYYLIRNPGAEIPTVDDLTTKGVSGSCQGKAEASVQLKNLSNRDAKDIYILVKNEAGIRSSIYRINIPAYVAPPTTYTVTLNNGTGYSLSAANGSSSPVNAGGSYSFTINVQNGYARGSNFTVKANDTVLTGNNGVYTISNINANQSVTVSGVVANSNQGGGYAPRPTVAAPSVTTTVLPSAVMGKEYKQQLTASGGAPITWSYTGTLPEGITLSSGGLLSGTPKGEGTFRFAVKVTNSAGTMTRQLSLVVAGNDYAVTQGSNAQWSQGMEEGLTFQGSGQSAFTVRIDGSAVPESKLTLSPDGKTVTVSPEYLETLSTGSHTLTLVYTDGSARAKFNVSSTAKTVPPTLAAQPMSREAKEGESATFTVTASGSNPVFQWQVDTGDGNGWTDIPGATAASYTVDGVTEDQTGWQYRCVITNAAGEAESNAATLTVQAALGDITASDAETAPVKKGGIGRILLFAGLGLAAIGLAVGLVIYFRRRNDFDDYTE